jgi:hypothetical protein
MVLAVPGQQVLADPTKGEVSVVKALEVGLACDETLPWTDQRKRVRRHLLRWHSSMIYKQDPEGSFPQASLN